MRYLTLHQELGARGDDGAENGSQRHAQRDAERDPRGAEEKALLEQLPPDDAPADADGTHDPELPGACFEHGR